MRYWDTVHPAVAAFYFMSVLLLSVFSAYPVLPLCALSGGIAFYGMLHRGRRAYRDVGADILLFLLVAVTNPLFVHNGVTPLFFLNGNAVTREALLCGLCLAAMLLSAVWWFRCFHTVMTSDKLLFLLSRFSPKTALLLSSALRFVPLFRQQAQTIRAVQTTMGLYASDSLLDRLRAMLRTYSSLITWSLENAVDTGASMRGRGYGLKGRTAFSLFCFGRRDALLTAVIASADLLVLAGMVCGRLDFTFYPRMTAGTTDGLTAAAVAAFGLLAFLPFISEVKEALRWHYYRSKI